MPTCGDTRTYIPKDVFLRRGDYFDGEYQLVDALGKNEGRNCTVLQLGGSAKFDLPSASRIHALHKLNRAEILPIGS